MAVGGGVVEADHQVVAVDVTAQAGVDQRAGAGDHAAGVEGAALKNAKC